MYRVVYLRGTHGQYSVEGSHCYYPFETFRKATGNSAIFVLLDEDGDPVDPMVFTRSSLAKACGLDDLLTYECPHCEKRHPFTVDECAGNQIPISAVCQKAFGSDYTRAVLEYKAKQAWAPQDAPDHYRGSTRVNQQQMLTSQHPLLQAIAAGKQLLF